ncbi:MAG: glycosyltransferase family 4 protein [Phycisphaeraceae bacterium]|nr:glycosyltransferase family 4 protein [Phycisphaeraceae bacterium]
MVEPHEPIRVLYVARAPFVSGAERALRSMLTHLDRSRIQPSLVLGCESELIDTARSLDIPVTVIGLPRRSLGSAAGWWMSLRKMRRLVDRSRPHLLHANDVPSCQAMCEIGRRWRIPTVVHVRWTITAREMAWWTRGAIRAAICISRYVQTVLGPLEETDMAGSRIEVIRDCVDWVADPPGQPEVAASDDIREAERDRRLTLGFAGQLIPSKGLDLVIRGLAGVQAARRPLLLVAGRDTQTGGAYQRELEALAQTLGVADSIQWLGFLDRMEAFYGRIDAVVCPSREEPLGLVPMEAARFAIPAVACEAGGLAESIDHDSTGWLIPPSPRAWAAFLNAMPQREQLRRAGLAAWEKARCLGDPARYIRRLETLYRSLTGQPADTGQRAPGSEPSDPPPTA